ncbi:hypothetical protein SEA_CHILL_19 [Mycobacterium phage Chill]|uniref:Uncharacterized protein n=4 Tax=Plotvirus plot TaxID=2170099 RepID=A0A481VTW5_9CAUD|nr:hypothetical protein PBI_BIGMAMA_16 [Mycobacterium phage BigMama]QBI97083.1 hypothetical protein SEA_CHILL_19 [Mycobacterium phage Chill]QBJ04733.1 hypothetical protein SEA_DELTON_18 [Mycobacterium phage Delton]QBP30016.1 hypothetical protein SEA_WALDOWHY_19 [Mycobacterium phage WaldoWhy]WQY91134.1 hypothetical protein BENZEMA_18 [Mycobacterium phage Benzema]
MASEADVQLFKTHLSGVDGIWEDSKISDTIDALGSVSKAVRAYWSEVVNTTYLLTDVSESGSSRNATIIYRNAMEQLQRWDGIIKEEDAKQEAETVGTVRFNRISRNFSS